MYLTIVALFSSHVIDTVHATSDFDFPFKQYANNFLRLGRALMFSSEHGYICSITLHFIRKKVLITVWYAAVLSF